MDTETRFSAHEERMLRSAVARYCECGKDNSSTFGGTCSLHVMLAGTSRADRRVLDGLLFVKRTLLTRMLLQEFDASCIEAGVEVAQKS